MAGRGPGTLPGHPRDIFAGRLRGVFMRNKARALGALLLLVLLVPGCGSDDDDEEYPVTELFQRGH
jgi:hypothetical protein